MIYIRPGENAELAEDGRAMSVKRRNSESNKQSSSRCHSRDCWDAPPPPNFLRKVKYSDMVGDNFIAKLN